MWRWLVSYMNSIGIDTERKKRKKVKLLSRVQLFGTPWTVAHQAPLSMGFSKQRYWSGLPFPSPGNLPNPRNEPGSPALPVDSLLSEPPGKPNWYRCFQNVSHLNHVVFDLKGESLSLSVDLSLSFSQTHLHHTCISSFSLKIFKTQIYFLPKILKFYLL